jgi:hypothetical protein
VLGFGGRSLDEEVVQEGADVEEDGLGVEEEFGEEGEVLGVQLWSWVSRVILRSIFDLPTLFSSPSTL